MTSGFVPQPNLLQTSAIASPSILHKIMQLQESKADLPSGQLAEASLTAYDINDRPNTGTLALDANDLNWFIDTKGKAIAFIA